MAFIGLERLSPSRMSMGRDGRDGCLSFSLLVCLSGKRFIFLVMQRPALNISVYKMHIRGIWKMEAEVPASIAETSRKVHVKFTWGESGLGILEKQMASAAAVQMMEMAEGHGASFDAAARGKYIRGALAHISVRIISTSSTNTRHKHK